MNILFVTPPPYLPNRQHRMRTFDLIRMLAKKNTVHLLAVTTKKEIPQEFEEIKKLCKSVTIIYIHPLRAMIQCLLHPLLPLEVAYCKSEKAIRKVEDIIKNQHINLVYLKRLRSGVYLPNSSIPAIIDTTDAMSMFYHRMYKNHNFPKNLYYGFEKIKYKFFEKNISKKINHWVTCSEIDKKYLSSFLPSIQIYVIPNVVDTNYFNPLLTTHYSLPTNSHSLLFRGLMDKPVNITAALFFINTIFPLIKKSIKDIKLFIVGPNPHPSIKILADNKHIFVTGFAEDIREMIKKTSVSICPIQIGAGTRYKILQAWAMGHPVISTTAGAEGLIHKHKKNILIADTPEEFAKHVVELFKNKVLYATLAKNSKDTVKKLYSISAVEKKLEKVLNEVSKKHTAYQ